MASVPQPSRPLKGLAGRKPSDGSKAPDAASPSPRATAAPRLTILVVDDVEDTRELYRHYFEFQGARVTTAADGVVALQSVVFDRPDVVVLDLAMPRMTGLQVLRSLKGDTRTRTIPVIVLSGQQARDVAMEAGADLYLQKPCLPDELLKELLHLLREPPHKGGE